MLFAFSRGYKKLFNKILTKIEGREAIVVSGLGDYSLSDTFECGQAFRFVKLSPDSEGRVNRIGEKCKSYVEYMTVIADDLIFVGQREKGELIFFEIDDEKFERICVPYFALDTNYDEIKSDILKNSNSEFLANAAECASGIRILKQDPWEALFSFIISQNNNIPRIKKIIRAISSAYGENLALKNGLSECPIKCLSCLKNAGKLNTDACESCGICYSFPKAKNVAHEPELLQDSHPGFRYKYLVDAAEKVSSGEIDFSKIIAENSYEYTLSELMKIKGVGEKVASCTSLFAFSNLEAFPIDVWMKRAIDEYFDGKLEPKQLGRYAGVAQQYIFHYIRKLSNIV